MANCLLTTIDNPHNPFTHYAEWRHYDTDLMSYNTEQLLDMYSYSNPYMDDDIASFEIEIAMDLLLKHNPSGLLVKMYKEDGDAFVKLCNQVYEKQFKSGSVDQKETP